MKTIRSSILTALVVAALSIIPAPQAKAARYEELSVTTLTLEGTVLTNTAARLNSAPASGDSISSPSVTAGSATIQTNASVAGVLTLSNAPKLPSALTATGTAVVAAGIRLPEGYSTNAAKFIEVTIGTTNYLIPMYVRP